MEATFYNRLGIPICYSEDGVHVYDFHGKPLAYFSDDCVYSFSGRHLGWLADGWILDKQGLCVLFSEHASGGPGKPGRMGRPGKAGKQGLPGKGGREGRPGKPGFASSWSAKSSRDIFAV